MTHSVLLIDDHDILRFGLETVILSCPELKLVGAASSLAQALELLRHTEPDLVISDPNLPDSQGLNSVRAVVEAQQGGPTLIACGCMTRRSTGRRCWRPVPKITSPRNTRTRSCPRRSRPSRRVWISPRLNSILQNRCLRRRPPGLAASSGEGENTLTRRELQVLEQLGGGKSTKEIASALGLSVRTVDLYRARMKRKLNLRSGAELIAFASHRT